MPSQSSFYQKCKELILGRSRNPQDSRIFHSLSLIAFFAWVGLGADGLSSSCYGPPEAFMVLVKHPYLGIFVGLATVLTIFIIATSYSQIVELFPTGGGGYLVASKLLSPAAGMVSGCALLIDYVLTITVSIASGADAFFSLLPLSLYHWRLAFAVGVLAVLILLNMRGVKESILPLVPIFLAFLVTHIFVIGYALVRHAPELATVATQARADIHSTLAEVGLWGMIALILKAYSMGAGTYTGIEAVSNGTPVLREPKVRTAKITMQYMAVSLSVMVLGLMIGYILYNVVITPGKTLNAALFEQVTKGWGASNGKTFIFIALFSEAALLFVAAQTGFLDGPRVLANMAKDRWFPNRFATLSDRLVVQNGILVMGILAAVLMVITRGSVTFLVILYSINVFITFVLSQAGMVRHWWSVRAAVKHWKRRACINGVGLMLSAFILVSMIVMKFHEGGWITLFITTALISIAVLIKRHYARIGKLLQRLDTLVEAVKAQETLTEIKTPHAVLPVFDPRAKTAVLLVNGFNGMGLHTLFGVLRMFPNAFKNFVFVEVGVVDVGNFKGVQEIAHLEHRSKQELGRYISFMNKEGFYAEGVSAMGVDVVDEVDRIAPDIIKRYPGAIFFGGQLIFPDDSFLVRFLHNYTVFALQKKLYRQGTPFVILPIRV